jgi:hypothetical protein
VSVDIALKIEWKLGARLVQSQVGQVGLPPGGGARWTPGRFNGLIGIVQGATFL